MKTVLFGAFGLCLVAAKSFDNEDLAVGFVATSSVIWGIACAWLDDQPKNWNRKYHA